MTPYETDALAWAKEQAAFLQAGDFESLDIGNLCEELLDMGASYHLELEHRASLLIAHLLKLELEHLASLLIAHLLKWHYQPERRGRSWELTLKEQRKQIARRLKKTPSLKADLNDPEWFEGVYGDAIVQALRETGLDCFPEVCPWTFEQIIDPEFFS